MLLSSDNCAQCSVHIYFCLPCIFQIMELESQQAKVTFVDQQQNVQRCYIRTIIHKSQPNSLIKFFNYLDVLVSSRDLHQKKLVLRLGQLSTESCLRPFIDVTVDCHIKIWKTWVPASSDDGLVMRPNVKVINQFGCDLWIIVRKLLYQPNDSIPRKDVLSVNWND